MLGKCEQRPVHLTISLCYLYPFGLSWRWCTRLEASSFRLRGQFEPAVAVMMSCLIVSAGGRLEEVAFSETSFATLT